MRWEAFKRIKTGQRVLNHGFDECVALANLYHEEVLGGRFVPVGAAYQWWTQEHPQVAGIYTRSPHPVAGAVFIARGGLYNTQFGHIGVVTQVHPDGSFSTLEQNAEKHRYVARYRRENDANVLGFLHPKINPAKGLSMSDIKIINAKLDQIIARQAKDKKSLDSKISVLANITRWIKARLGGSIYGKSLSQLMGDTSTLDATAEDIAAALLEQLGFERSRAVAAAISATPEEQEEENNGNE